MEKRKLILCDRLWYEKEDSEGGKGQIKLCEIERGEISKTTKQRAMSNLYKMSPVHSTVMRFLTTENL